MCGALRSLIPLNHLGEPISLLLLIPTVNMLQLVGLAIGCPLLVCGGLGRLIFT